ncbi:uncharacterized protein I206_100205 [Kwoniella pini CBS 10737]|uniref:Uncharacterized protein n=1 Tax=Kwoniella pini CBS 10737 TaxID=1296096 RepID=A0A1B9IE46_9TREE|nr:uncharacterized protein I206_01120 [Kwoniella pini CBS 10737]OCF53813.1 hypothetical protein I206_01120 [Kwoniella pini CBS 10737]
MSETTAPPPTAGASTAGSTLMNPAATQATGQAGTTGQQDALDKGVDYILGKAGHKQNASTTEKISDGIRSGFKKLTGKDIPIKDKQ